MPNFSIPLSGLTASSTALSTISNNLSNLNTTGYKETRITFRDLFYQNLGSNGAGNTMQVGAGTAVASVDTIFTGGSVSTTGVNTDVAITGSGFFVVQNDGTTMYTRAGDFTRDTSGYLTTSDGYQVMGYPAVNGVVDTNGALSPIQLGKGLINPPKATASMNMNVNLNSAASVGDNYTTDVTVYDSLGQSHQLKFTFTKTSTGWNYDATIPSAELSSGAGSTTSVKSGSLTFDSKGNLDTTSLGSNIPITVNGLSDGAANMSFTWNLMDTNNQPRITELASASGTASTYQDGYASGTLNDFSINADGTIVGAFTNGTKILGQIALANFANEQGLTKMGANNYASTISSGSAVVGLPGTSGRGKLSGGALEGSNVDMAQEFANLIVAQRGFQANAKAVTAFDEVTQDTINLKR